MTVGLITRVAAAGMALLVVGGPVLTSGARCVANDPRMLLLAAEYKLLVRDDDSAGQLLARLDAQTRQVSHGIQTCTSQTISR